MSKNLFKIEKCVNAKIAFKDTWERGKNCYAFPKIQEKEKANLIEPIHNLASSMYYTFSKVTYEMSCISFAMFVYTRNSKWTVSSKPFKLISSDCKNPLKNFTDTLNIIYPSKRPAACVIYITYPCCSPLHEDWEFVGRPYFPCSYIGGRLPMLNNKTFKTEECQICYENPSCVLFCVCGHICICEECLKIYKSPACPICKTYNEYIRKIELV